MRDKKKFEWATYIEELPDFPLLIQDWEQQFVGIIFEKIPVQEMSKVLEVGCSNGRWLRWFHRTYNCEVWGLDKERAGSEGSGDVIRFTMGDALNMPYRDNSFDVVFSMGLVEHFSKKVRYQILREQRRVLKEGGHLICQAPLLNLFSVNFFYVRYAYDYKKGTKHYRTTRRELKGYLRNLGLEIVFSGSTGCLFELSFLKQLSRLALFSNLFATEILVIAEKMRYKNA